MVHVITGLWSTDDVPPEVELEGRVAELLEVSQGFDLLPHLHDVLQQRPVFLLLAVSQLPSRPVVTSRGNNHRGEHSLATVLEEGIWFGIETEQDSPDLQAVLRDPLLHGGSEALPTVDLQDVPQGAPQSTQLEHTGNTASIRRVGLMLRTSSSGPQVRLTLSVRCPVRLLPCLVRYWSYSWARRDPRTCSRLKRG